MADSFLSEEEYALLRREKCSKLTDDQFSVFRHAVERFQLDPFGNQIYAQVRTDRKTNKTNMSIQTGIDGYRLIADRTHCYAGNDDPIFDDEKEPAKATVTVWKIVGGLRCPFTATARWEQYFPGEYLGAMWRRMPHLMLGKCAEALALRKAFPAELSGLYTAEEMQQAAAAAPPNKTVPKSEPLSGKPLGHKGHVGPVSDVEPEQKTLLPPEKKTTDAYDAECEHRAAREMHKGPPSSIDPTPPEEKEFVDGPDIGDGDNGLENRGVGELTEWQTAVAALASPESCREFYRDLLPSVPAPITKAVKVLLLKRVLDLETSVGACTRLLSKNPELAEELKEAVADAQERIRKTPRQAAN